MREKEQEGHGRLPEKEQAQGTIRDISDIDRQEGSMHHGETGGNFDGKKEKQEYSKEKKPK